MSRKTRSEPAYLLEGPHDPFGMGLQLIDRLRSEASGDRFKILYCMSRRAFYRGFLLIFLGVAAPNFGQQGHPLTGTWNGDYGTNPTQRTPITIVMTWDGKEVKGIANPAPLLPSIAD